MGAITASEARKRLFPLIEAINQDADHVLITSRAGNAVLVSEAEWDAWQETMYLLRTPANARRLLHSIAQADAGQFAEHELVDPE
ncbi:MAG: type II toxin-antitoxin system prevent-host-death family antitoxin [Actinomycetota bacterium]|nr:type II toxin-antitoxin system prevent-host-death family antitoxin [Actinomycetota bacterium]